MARSRVELHHKLEAILGSKNVYFDPPESFKLSYPCIVYYLEGYEDWPADNAVYHRLRRYSMTFITTDSEDPIAEELQNLRYCNLNRAPFAASDLFHFPYTIKY